MAAILVPAPVLSQEPPGTWELVPGLNTDGRYDDLWFIDAQNGWTVNYYGQLYGTDDGGATWMLRFDAGIDVHLRSVTFLDEMHGFVGAIGDSAHALWETTDGGYTLTNITGRISGPLPEGICGMWAIDSLTVVAVGQVRRTPRFLKTTDGGLTWSSRDMSTVVDNLDGLVDVRFLDAQRGIAVGNVGDYLSGEREKAVVLLTEDGGETWSVRHTTGGPIEWAWKIDFPTPDVGYVVVQYGEPEIVLKTTDAGLTWTELPIPPGGAESGIAFISAEVGWIGGLFDDGSYMALTMDGGETWTTLASPVDPSVINRIRFFDFGEGRFGFAGGGAFYRYRPGVSPATEGPTGLPPTWLGAPVPNPFEDETHLAYAIERAAHVRLEVFDASGRRVAVLVDARQPAGSHEARWDGADATGRRMAAGSYVVRLMAAGETRVQLAVMSR